MEPIQSNKIYPIGIQNFEKMRKGGYFYVDKTALVYRLVRNSLKGWRWRSWRKTG